MASLKPVVVSLVFFLIELSWADVSHFFGPEFGFFHQQPQHQLQHPFQFALQPPPPQPSLPSLYSAPPPQQQQQPGGYPNPIVPTPAPVAPLPSTTTEFTLPEIIENRNAKEYNNFIPLQSLYLPPEERPNYESPKLPNQGYLPPPPHSDSHHHHKHPIDQLSYSESPSGGYYYPRPGRPITTTTKSTTTTTTERPIISPIIVVDQPEFIPPISNDSPLQGYDYNAPLSRPSTPAPVYLPPSSDLSNEDSGLVVQQATDGSSSLRLRVKEMRCLQHQGGYFRSVLKVDSFISAVPSVDNDSYDKRCELKLSRSFVVIDLAEEVFQKCGVHSCGKDLCLRLRFPAIRGMRTGSDAILTLHCKTQDRVAVKTHALKMGVTNDVQARSIGTYAHGGSQNPFRTHVELLRKSNNGFTRHLESNGAVQLGEELLLRAHVLTGDGWNYTKLSDVSLQRISPSGELLNSANLITPHGCINPSMQGICKEAPTYDPPLGHKLLFNAVMFQGMHSGDELVMSMRITGCLEQYDCQVNTQECSVGGNGVVGRRRKRNTDLEISEVTRIPFRVIMRDDDEQRAAEDSTNVKKYDEGGRRRGMSPRALILAGSLGFVILLMFLGIFAMVKLRK